MSLSNLQKKPVAVLLLAATIGCHGGGGPTTPAERRARSARELQSFDERSNLEESALGIGIGFVGMVVAYPFVELGQGIRTLAGHTAANAAKKMEDTGSADARRDGIVDLVSSWDFAKKPPYTTRYAQIARKDSDPLVRATAIRALNISRDASATGVFIAALEDESPLVRLEATKALGNIPDEKAIAPLIRRLEGHRQITFEGRPTEEDETDDIRITAAWALRRYRTMDVALTLVSYVQERNFGVAWEVRRSLMHLTGQDCHFSQAEWLKYITGPEKPLG